jgi:NADH-quinone oxidoreductase subunit G
LRDGDPGRRLIEPAQAAKATYFNETPAAFRPRDGEWLVTPLYHIFGSEELSALSPAVAERSPQPYLALNPETAGSRRISEGEEVELVLDGAVYRLRVSFHPELPRGVAGLPAGLPDLPWAALPAWGRIESVNREM